MIALPSGEPETLVAALATAGWECFGLRIGGSATGA